MGAVVDYASGLLALKLDVALPFELLAPLGDRKRVSGNVNLLLRLGLAGARRLSCEKRLSLEKNQENKGSENSGFSHDHAQ